MFEELMTELEERMDKALDALKDEFATIRTGRANVSLLEGLTVDYYGVPTPVTQVATVTVPEQRLLMIQPWDKSLLHAVEKAIQQSDLGLAPNNDGAIIRLNIPQLNTNPNQTSATLQLPAQAFIMANAIPNNISA